MTVADFDHLDKYTGDPAPASTSAPASPRPGVLSPAAWISELLLHAGVQPPKPVRLRRRTCTAAGKHRNLVLQVIIECPPASVRTLPRSRRRCSRAPLPHGVRFQG
ncbi:hypothetical protein LV779_35205 [Streptomyces thinghirensis]|nr:hypothetical protein [Streptomyces thinghirensis]